MCKTCGCGKPRKKHGKKAPSMKSKTMKLKGSYKKKRGR